MENNIDIFDTIDFNINWKNHLDEVNQKLNNMWSFLLYNQFCEKEVIELKNKNKALNHELEDLRYATLMSTGTKNDTRKRKRQEDLLKDEFRKVKRYKSLSKEDRETLLKEIFLNLNSIEDIINLKKHPKKFDFISNIKFNKLYNIIPSLEELTNIIGMNNVKDKIFRSICYFLHSIHMDGQTNPNEMNHIMIMGPPGVGKTTVAQIMGKIYLQLGFLENDNFITATRSDLVAKYLGQTADKTQKVIDSALGGVLFIDEVYSLGSKEGRDSFAKECIDTINLNMSRIDRPWLLIVGGYKEDIEESFLAHNKGLERRFTIKLEIKGYDEKELFDILMSFIKKEKWDIEENAITIKDIKDNIDRFKYFGGDMRKLFQLAKENYCVRIMKMSINLDNCNRKLSKDDFNKSIEQFKPKDKENTSHLMMYI
jgi:SpoVK/Ycf46/Vps4 family AAA+-type ATPase